MKGEVAAADRRGVLRASLALAAAAILNLDPAAAQDENFPSRTISMVTHAGPGGGTDITTRMMMVIARAELGQELVVLNKTGGSGVAALQYAMSQPRDGYTVLTITQSHIFQILQEKVPLKVDDLVGIARATLDPQIIAVRADSPIKDLKGLIEASKAKLGGLKWGTTFVGGADHVAIHSFAKALGGIPYVVVPFRGGGDIVTNLVGGNLDAALLNYAEGESQFKSNISAPSPCFTPARRDQGHSDRARARHYLRRRDGTRLRRAQRRARGPRENARGRHDQGDEAPRLSGLPQPGRHAGD